MSLSAYKSLERAEAEHALRQIGTNAIPTLLRMLRAKDSALMSRLQERDRYHRLLKVNSNPAWLQNQEASVGFRVLGADAKDVVSAVVATYEENISPRSRMAAAESLSNIGPAARAAIPTLLRAATNSDPSLRPSALWGLVGIQAEPTATVPVLVRCLGDTNRFVRSLAHRSLYRLGEEARPALTQLLNNPDPDLRRNAQNALNNILPKTPGYDAPK